MKKLFLGLTLLLSLFMGLSFTKNVVEAAEPPTESFTFNYTYYLDGGTNVSSSVTATYGQKINFAENTIENYEYVGYIVNDKVEPSINTSSSITVTNNTTLEIFYKPAGSTAVIFMDSNQEFIDVLYTDKTGETPTNYLVGTIPSYSSYTKPGLTANGWIVDSSLVTDLATTAFTSDTVVYVSYPCAKTSGSVRS